MLQLLLTEVQDKISPLKSTVPGWRCHQKTKSDLTIMRRDSNAELTYPMRKYPNKHRFL